MSLWVLRLASQIQQIPKGGEMRDYTYFAGARFGISNIFRSQRFDIDRLDINWVDDEMPEFVRGVRIVDFTENETYTLQDKDADNLMYSFAYIYSNSSNEKFIEMVDEYLKTAIESKEYLITEDKKKTKETLQVVH
jgi:hypothetical protein